MFRGLLVRGDPNHATFDSPFERSLSLVVDGDPMLFYRKRSHCSHMLEIFLLEAAILTNTATIIFEDLLPKNDIGRRSAANVA